MNEFSQKFDVRVGDRVRVEIEGIVLERHSNGPHVVIDAEFGRKHTVWTQRKDVSLEILAPALEWLEGDVIRDDRGDLYNRMMTGVDGWHLVFTFSRLADCSGPVAPLTLLLRDGKPAES